MTTKTAAETTSALIDDSTAAPQTRLYYLDWLRVLLILGVFLFHAVHPFDAIDWHIKNEEQSVLLSAIMLVLLYPWGLPLFFLVAGAGSRFALRRRSGKQYAIERVYRLLIPFIVGAILLTPFQEYLEVLNKGTYEGSFTAFLPEMIAQRRLGLDMLSPRVFGNWGFHLWFLGFLFAYSILALPIFLWLKRENGQRLIRFLGGLAEKRGGIFLFIIPLVLARFLFQPFFPVEHDWADFIYTFLFFIVGYIFYSDDRFLRAVQRERWWLLAAGVGSALILLGLFATGSALEWVDTFTVPWSNLLWLVFSITSWSVALYVLALAMRRLNITNRWLVYGNEAVLPFYLLHQPVIIAIAFFVVQMTWSLPVKAVLVVFGSLFVTLGLVEIVRRIPLLRILFGVKTPKTA
ncbi:MAG: acyltransferase family protein [Anaerolineales bacterium]|nr:acyltransferase family protein [Anaerolineales bacterium]